MLFVVIDFGRTALPYCSFRPPGGDPRLGVGVGTTVVDLAAVRLDSVDPALVSTTNLDRLLAADSTVWTALHDELTALAAAGDLDGTWSQSAITLELAWTVADYVDFYSSRHHAETVGRLFRPDGDALPPSWLHLPIGYHGRAGTVIVDGTPVRRPRGQIRRPDGSVRYQPSEALDFELEVGWVLGGRSTLGEPVDVARADRHLFGVVLVDDWSARDIQAWEYVPLGPFLGKSFATTVSAWVMPLASLTRIPAAPQDPPPLDHLRADDPWTVDLQLEAWVDPVEGGEPVRVCQVEARDGLYWTPAQQLAHLTSNGATVRPGDLFASGTVSAPGRPGCLLEASAGGVAPVIGSRSYLADGDGVRLIGTASTPKGPVSLGPASGVVQPG